MRRGWAAGLVLGLAVAGMLPAAGQELENGGSGQAILPGHGASTNLPVPRFVSLKSEIGNVR
ncbi:MAG: hypothetical protein JSR87_07530, partial [Proteobacteria bacterium]|nr:hypothetical protein [Pseudomonadota bacterium]